MVDLQYRHVDVFSDIPFSGSGLTVFILETELSTDAMQTVTQEMRQFESIFLTSTTAPNRFRARIFTVEEELDFAGHPILGAACVMHEKFGKAERAEWQIELNAKTVEVITVRNGVNFKASMEQGKPEFGAIIEGKKRSAFAHALNLSESDLADDLPLEIVSTGLPYLIVPLKRNVESAKIVVPDFEEMLTEFGAKFVYVFQLSKMEGRTWDNSGLVEDVATGSASGPMVAFLIKYKVCQPETEYVLHQGSFVERPSRLFIKATGTQEDISSIQVAGDVCLIASGRFDDNIFSI